MIEIIYTDWGVANTYKTEKGYTIEVNKKLKEFPDLLERILKHEFEHAKVKEKGLKGFAKQRRIDALTDVKLKDLFPFFKKHPKTAIQQYSPITYKDNTIYFEWSLILLYTMYIGLAFGIYYLINLFSTNEGFFWAVIEKMVLIFFGIGVLYIIGKKLREYINEEAKKTQNQN